MWLPIHAFPDNKFYGANMGPTWALSAPDGPMLAPWTLLSGLRSTAGELNQETFDIYPIISDH